MPSALQQSFNGSPRAISRPSLRVLPPQLGLGVHTTPSSPARSITIPKGTTPIDPHAWTPASLKPDDDDRLAEESLKDPVLPTKAGPVPRSEPTSDPSTSTSHLSIPAWLLFVLAAALLSSSMNVVPPLLVEIGKEFDVGERESALAATATSSGFLAGISIIGPLGDVFDKKVHDYEENTPTSAVSRYQLIDLLLNQLPIIVVAAVAIASISNILLALVPSYPAFLVACFSVGLFCQGAINVPFAVDLAAPNRRGAVVGTLAAGANAGSLLGRVLAGHVAEKFGLRVVFLCMAVETALIAAGMGLLLPRKPKQQPKASKSGSAGTRAGGSLATLVHVLGNVVTDGALLRLCAMAFVQVTAFGTFWTTSTFLLTHPPFNFSPGEVGMLSLVGVAGIAATFCLGFISDVVPRGYLTITGTLIGLSVWTLLLAFGQTHVWAVFGGAFWLDVGSQMVTIVNRAACIKLYPAHISTVNTIYSLFFVAGLTTGNTLGPAMWVSYGWPGVCVVGLVCGVGVQAIFLSGIARRWVRAGQGYETIS
ncbi:MFS general substrate transporter [Gonapodya prolifera JEL478]|uniref:MFS general substrate transporter n=1 Tax=Gonapodya prolifera (strain JEL478) TaxID=1344416 RepID=A0A139A930_GONPJ|nr:MFS general substrate transporter [Gonapodya prolifera JEL478]|eukprot:KXS13322.1 MFS general substrate transporter [Gonapodya prolifera JEL478]